MAIARFLDCMCLALRASGLWLRSATLQNLIPSFPWIAPPRPPPWRNPRKGRNQILPSEVRSSEADDNLEVDDDFPYELLEDPDEVNDVLELYDVLELHFILVKLTSN